MGLASAMSAICLLLLHCRVKEADRIPKKCTMLQFFGIARWRNSPKSIGVVERTTRNSNGNAVRVQLEIDFVCNRADRRYYVQSAFEVPDAAKAEQETRPFVHIDDSFKKIVVVRDDSKPWHDNRGILFVGLWDFLLNEDSLDW